MALNGTFGEGFMKRARRCETWVMRTFRPGGDPGRGMPGGGPSPHRPPKVGLLSRAGKGQEASETGAQQARVTETGVGWARQAGSVLLTTTLWLP